MKTFIKTSDIFNCKDFSKSKMLFDHCYEKAIEVGLLCNWNLNYADQTYQLFMKGSKNQFIKYYLATLLQTENKLDGVKRLIDIVLT